MAFVTSIHAALSGLLHHSCPLSQAFSLGFRYTAPAVLYDHGKRHQGHNDIALATQEQQ